MVNATEEFLTANAIPRDTPEASWFTDELRFTHRLALQYQPAPYDERVVLVRALEQLQAGPAGQQRPTGIFLGWDRL